jgi:hypothetical protein
MVGKNDGDTLGAVGCGFVGTEVGEGVSSKFVTPWLLVEMATVSIDSVTATVDEANELPDVVLADAMADVKLPSFTARKEESGAYIFTPLAAKIVRCTSLFPVRRSVFRARRTQPASRPRYRRVRHSNVLALGFQEQCR